MLASRVRMGAKRSKNTMTFDIRGNGYDSWDSIWWTAYLYDYNFNLIVENREREEYLTDVTVGEKYYLYMNDQFGDVHYRLNGEDIFSVPFNVNSELKRFKKLEEIKGFEVEVAPQSVRDRLNTTRPVASIVITDEYIPENSNGIDVITGNPQVF